MGPCHKIFSNTSGETKAFVVHDIAYNTKFEATYANNDFGSKISPVLVGKNES